MHLTGIQLQAFRSYPTKYLELSPSTTIIVGPNAVGKTSIIEALNLLSTGESFRAGRLDETILFDQEYARVKGVMVQLDNQDKVELEMMLTRGVVQGKKTQRALYSVNGVRRRKASFVGHFYTVVFRPEDMRLIEGSPARRRTFLNTALSTIDRGYAQALNTYDQTLKRRNKLLFQVRERLAPPSVLTFWNLTLAKHGEVLQEKRQLFLDTFSSIQFPLTFRVEYRPSLISLARIEEYLPREIAAGHTLIGPHKDDLGVILHRGDRELDIAVYGSRGQQRMGVLWLKLGEVQYLEHRSGQKVMVLLDDILSELDAQAQQHVMDLLPQRQTIITTIDPDLAAQIQEQFSNATLHSLLN